MKFNPPADWQGTSSDPNDEQFGHVVQQTSLDEADEYDAVIVGEPYDGAVISRKGAADGPAAIRDALAGTKSHHFDAGPVSKIGDLGDVAIPSGSVAEVQEAVLEATNAIHGQDAIPVFLGGDNSLTFPNVAPLLDDGSVGVINFDAHLDVREVPESGLTSGTPYRQLHDAGLDGYACVGARHFETSTKYHDFVCDNDGEVVTAEEARDDPVTAIDSALSALSHVDTLYLSVDIDVLDAAYPGSSAPTPGGLSPGDLFRMVRMAASDDRVAGFEVVECAPPLDANNRTVDAAARTVAHFLAGWAA
ncbi:formimidoylglutamase [Haladaptatus sp. GCM10025707]|uniref:formimidoylglutamase n=1 Tax=unclassified Haladaptatus TaxID=2622732 RepID=UPI0023E806E5|nr:MULTISPECIES: formimidoylglutamase [unclassified Haladaptatus]